MQQVVNALIITIMAPRKVGLPDLPRELRDETYRYDISNHTRVLIPSRTKLFKKHRLLPSSNLQWACKQTHIEYKQPYTSTPLPMPKSSKHMSQYFLNGLSQAESVKLN